MNDYEIIEILLRANAALRDNDEALFVEVIRAHKLDPSTLTVSKAMLMIAEGELPAFDTVQRYRRAAQERDPELRGRRYELRQHKAGRHSQSTNFSLDKDRAL